MCATEEMIQPLKIYQHLTDLVSEFIHVSACVFCSKHVATFHACASTRNVLPHVCFHEKCTLHDTSKRDTSKRGPCKHVMGMHCSIVVVPHVNTHV